MERRVDEGSSIGGQARNALVRSAGTILPVPPGICVLPELRAGDGPLAPIVLWYAVLFALSMLARYAPKQWVEVLDPDTSAEAVPLETLLEAALGQVPAYILATLQDPLHWRPGGQVSA